jgi:hypothetical protein
MNVLRAAVIVCDCQKGALVYFEDQQNAGQVAYNMQHRMEANAPDLDIVDGISFRICADVEVGHCPACAKELPVAESFALPENRPQSE